MLTRETIIRAFEIMGTELYQRKKFAEIAVYGGSALVFEFDWRLSTEDVDVVIREVSDHGEAIRARDVAARELGLERSWLNEGVSVYLADRTLESLSMQNIYPRNGVGLRVLVATPEYIAAMKCRALPRGTAGDRDMNDLEELVRELGLNSLKQLIELHDGYFPDDPLPALSLIRAQGLFQS